MRIRGRLYKRKEISEIDKLRQEFVQKQLIQPKHFDNQKSIFAEMHSNFDKWLNGAGSKSLKSLSYVLFHPIIEKNKYYFQNISKNLSLANMHILPETYTSIMIGASLLLGIIAALSVGITMTALSSSLISTLSAVLTTSFGMFFLALIVFYTYPGLMANQRRTSIETNLPFALNHMSAISSSGVPPQNIFKLLTKLGDYGAITEESQKITKIVDVFGEDITTALSKTAKETPSKEFKDLLYGILSVIESGGSLPSYLKESAEISLFNYKLLRKKYLETLSTFADIYTALLIAAPLFLVSILVVINIIPGSVVGGLTITTILKGGVYVAIPLLNILFLILLTYTQPEV